MRQATILKMVLMLVCSFAYSQAHADDASEQQKIFAFAVATSPECQSLPADVPQSIILNDGDVVVRDPAGMARIPNNIQLQTQIQNCISRVGNAIQEQGQQASPTLVNKLRAAAMKFLVGITATVNSNNAPEINSSTTGQLGIRG